MSLPPALGNRVASLPTPAIPRSPLFPPALLLLMHLSVVYNLFYFLIYIMQSVEPYSLANIRKANADVQF